MHILYMIVLIALSAVDSFAQEEKPHTCQDLARINSFDVCYESLKQFFSAIERGSIDKERADLAVLEDRFIVLIKDMDNIPRGSSIKYEGMRGPLLARFVKATDMAELLREAYPDLFEKLQRHDSYDVRHFIWGILTRYFHRPSYDDCHYG